MKKLFVSLFENRKEFFIILILLMITGFLHGFNMFEYPSYREDEGTYMSQAWAVTNKDQLAPYTYWYDHSPVGWIFISLWNLITGGVFSFGVSINSGRVFMLILHILSTFILYKTMKNITRRSDVAFLAGLIFSISPLGIIFQRRVLLDNIMVFWLMLSFLFISFKPSIKNNIWSAAFFALAVLSKESAIFLLPLICLFIFIRADKVNRSFVTLSWLVTSLLLISIYPLFAFIKGEFFPAGTLLGGNTQHVSLIDALRFQSSRTGGNILSDGSSFQYALSNTWIIFDSFLLILGIVASFLNMFFSDKWGKLLGSMSLIFLVTLIFGNVLDWYIIPLIPIFAMNISFLYYKFSEYSFKFPRLKFIFIPIFLLILGAGWFFEIISSSYIYDYNQTQNQVNAISWLKSNIGKKEMVLIDNYAFLDLNQSFTNIENAKYQYYWKADTDPQIKDSVLKDNWKNIDYLVVTPAFRKTIFDDNLILAKTAYENSTVIKIFNDSSRADQNYPVEIRKVNNGKTSTLEALNP